MGKKRSKQNKRNKNSLQNPLNENQGNFAPFHDVKEREDDKNSSSNAEKNVLNSEVASFISNYDNLNSNPNSSQPNQNSTSKNQCLISGNTETQLKDGALQDSNPENIYPKTPKVKSGQCKEISITTRGSLRKENQKSSFAHSQGAKPKTLSPNKAYESEFFVKSVMKNSSDSESDYDYILPSQRERVKPKSNLNSAINKSTICRCRINKSSGSDDDHSASDLEVPISDYWQINKYKDIIKAENLARANDRLNFCPNDTPFRWEDRLNFYGNNNYSFDKLKDMMTVNVHTYKGSKDSFKDIYDTWLPERENSVRKLKELYCEVHKVQLSYNKSQVALRELSYGSRSLKSPEQQALNLFASVTAFLSDAASGVVSAVQAANIETYQKRFLEIMKQDAKITKKLYAARSECVAKYHDIEEVMKKFEFETFSSTVNKISNTLEVDKYWKAMKHAYERDDMPQLLNVASKFFNNATQFSKLEEISNSIQNYTDDNPAAKDIYKFAGRAMYGALDTVSVKRSQNIGFKGIHYAANGLLMKQDRVELDFLKSTVHDENSQSKLEAQIEEAINCFRDEITEMRDIYEELFKYQFDGDEIDQIMSFAGISVSNHHNDFVNRWNIHISSDDDYNDLSTDNW